MDNYCRIVAQKFEICWTDYEVCCKTVKTLSDNCQRNDGEIVRTVGEMLINFWKIIGELFGNFGRTVIQLWENYWRTVVELWENFKRIVRAPTDFCY